MAKRTTTVTSHKHLPRSPPPPPPSSPATNKHLSAFANLFLSYIFHLLVGVRSLQKKPTQAAAGKKETEDLNIQIKICIDKKNLKMQIVMFYFPQQLRMRRGQRCGGASGCSGGYCGFIIMWLLSVSSKGFFFPLPQVFPGSFRSNHVYICSRAKTKKESTSSRQRQKVWVGDVLHFGLTEATTRCADAHSTLSLPLPLAAVATSSSSSSLKIDSTSNPVVSDTRL